MFTGMRQQRTLTAIIEREGDDYVALCPALEVASQCDTVAAARANLIEALELFFETVHRMNSVNGCTLKCW